MALSQAPPRARGANFFLTVVRRRRDAGTELISAELIYVCPD